MAIDARSRDEAGPDDAPRWVEIDGRRWRASDPSIPSAFRQELIDELMRARRALQTVVSCGDEGLVRDTRRQVHAAKVALGERGEPWWEPPSEEGQRDRVTAAILALAGNRAPQASICPSDAARAVGGPGWRALVPVAREAARELARSGVVVITQRGEPVDLDATWKGPVRIRMGPR